MRCPRLPALAVSLLIVLGMTISPICQALIKPIQIIAAENFYGAVAKTIGGQYVQVHSILSNPNADPHLFATSPQTSTAVSKASILIYNGAGYDAWIKPIIASQAGHSMTVVKVSQLLHQPDLKNPHIWYNPATFPTLAKYLAPLLIQKTQQAGAAQAIQKNLQRYLKENEKVQQKINDLKEKFQGIIVTATEPVFNDMAQAIGLQMKGQALQWNIMNDTSPAPKTLQQFENSLIKRKVSLLFYNKQVSTPLTDNLIQLARKNKIITMGVSETMPVLFKKTNAWLTAVLDQTEGKLNQSGRHDH